MPKPTNSVTPPSLSLPSSQLHSKNIKSHPWTTITNTASNPSSKPWTSTSNPFLSLPIHSGVNPSFPSSSSSSSSTPLVSSEPRCPLTPTSPDPFLPSFQQRLVLFLDTTVWGYVYTFIDAFFTFTLAMMYILTSTYVITPLPKGWMVCEFWNAFMVLVVFLPRFLFFYPTESWTSRCARPAVCMTLLTVLPTLVFRAPSRWNGTSTTTVYEHDATGSFLMFVWPLRFLRLLWSLRRFIAISETYHAKWIPMLSLAQAKLVSLMCGVICTLSTCAGFLHIIEFKYTFPPKIISFFDAFFFTSLIATTISYDSNIVPDALFPRSAILVIILVGIAFVPYGIAQVVSAMHLRSPFEKAFKRGSNQAHVVVVGAVHEAFTLRHFLNEFFGHIHGNQVVHTQVVLLSVKDPPSKCLRLLREPKYRHRVQWVKGSPLSIEGLNKANVEKAKACFVLAKKFSSLDSRTTDAENILRTMALAKCSPRVPIYVQCLLPENKPHFGHFAENVFCIDELKLAVLAWSCLCPGFSTLFYLFTTSIPKTLQTRDGSINTTSEFMHSYGQGIYPTFLHPSLQGYRFTHVVQNLYRVLGVFMVAWQRTSPHGLKLELFGSYPLACVQGNEPVYVIASHPTLANQVALMDDSQMQPIQFTESSSCWLPLPMAMDFPSFHRRRSFHSSRFKNAHSPPHPSSVGFPASYPGERMGTQDASSVPVHGKGRDLSLHRFHTVDGSQRYASTFSHEHEQPHFYGVYQHEDEGESEDGDESLMVKPEQEEKEEEEEECKNGNRKANEAQSFTLCTTNTNNVTPGTCLLTPLMMHEPTLDLSTSLPLTDVPTSSSSTEPHPTWEHHILICSTALTKFPSHLDVLVNILRHQQPYTPIVILSPVTPEKTMQFNLCSVFSSSCGGGGGGGGYGASSAFKHQVFHVIGNPLNIVDLHRSGAEKVARVVVLADESTKLKESSNDLGDRNGQRETEKTEDANVIMTLFNLKAVCRPNVFIVVEFIHNETMRFLTESDIHTASEKDAIEEIIPFLSPSFMAGNVFTVSMLDAMLSQAYHQPYFIPFWQSLLLNTPMGVHVYQVGLPPFLRNKPFYELVHYFLNHHLLVLGLFRSHPTLHQRYVILAPSSHVLVLPEDRVFVLGQNQYWENEPPEETHGIKKIKKERSCE